MQQRAITMMSVGTRATAACAIALGMALPAIAFAQAAAGGAGGIRRSNVPGPGNSCSQLSGMPSMLVHSPQGMAILKMESELNQVRAARAALPEQERATVDELKIQRMLDQVDSVRRVVIRESDNGSGGRGMTVTIVFDSASAATRKDIELKMRELRAQMPELFATAARPSMTPRAAEAAGSVGLVLSGSSLKTMINGKLFIAYCEYPVVESIEPESPADKAGILSGDTVIAYNGRDLLEQDLDFSQLLVPGQVLRMRFHRAGKQREVLMIPVKRREDMTRVIVRPRTPCTGSACELGGNMFYRLDGDSTFTIRLLQDSLRPVRGFMVPPSRAAMVERKPPSGDVARAEIKRTEGARGGMVAAGAVVNGQPMPQGFMFAASSEIVSGARLMVIDEDMASTMGLDSAGIMIQSVLPGTPAAEAGLKKGEFVREVNGAVVRDLLSVRKALFGSEHIRLLVTSKSAPTRTVVLR